MLRKIIIIMILFLNYFCYHDLLLNLYYNEILKDFEEQKYKNNKDLIHRDDAARQLLLYYYKFEEKCLKNQDIIYKYPSYHWVIPRLLAGGYPAVEEQANCEDKLAFSTCSRKKYITKESLYICILLVQQGIETCKFFYLDVCTGFILDTVPQLNTM